MRSTCDILAGDASPNNCGPGRDRIPPGSVIIIIPTYEIATLLCQNYEAIFDPMCRILHIPSLKSLVGSIYLQITQNQPVVLGQAALLLAVFAVSAFFTPPLVTAEWAKTQDSSAGVSKILAKSASDVLSHSRQVGSGSLEDIQAHVIMSYVTFHHDGSPQRGRFHTGAALALCRELGLHCVDADSDSIDMHLSPRSKVDRELKRRVFWYLASSEW